ncbi:Uncharacterised protein [BD1-7 clade bacterium]|uniref:Uncharacterized protein n=1 Tax=BD1-7 clade bacterium TaxID=2029982 RepID=A0A5S9QQW3_9GAMM|nr:Uncharacterised protein [BD1-7 clade bacterium]CAA0121729.1 Uncharacterised protein [BD1-7 clade bacterium]
MTQHQTLPQVLAGPIVRRFTAKELVVWLVTSDPLSIRATIEKIPQQLLYDADCDAQPLQIGERAYVYLLRMPLQTACDDGDIVCYDLLLSNGTDKYSLAMSSPDLLFPDEDRFTLVFHSQVRQLLHGSCRKPHHPGRCGLAAASRKLAVMTPTDRPALLMMAGDQIYVDDVAGPMLSVIKQTIDRLGLWPERLDGALVEDSDALYRSEHCYYEREALLPHDKKSQRVEKRVFTAVKKPIFTSVSAHNHLITLSEVMAMYLLVWSDVLWADVDNGYPFNLAAEHHDLFDQEAKILKAFVQELPDTRRLFAHIPVYMIFDDHDVTDDWNLTRDWEETAYNHPFSRRIIGNALAAYFVCQGWGNAPETFESKVSGDAEGVAPNALRTYVNAAMDGRPEDAQDAMINTLLRLECWHYAVPMSPPLLVLDTRTRRWRSESNANKPSGLLDWEALSELQSELINHDAVILVSAAPIFGVKVIEAIQGVFTFIGKPLMVDAENWMAHRGTANVILNIFGHRKTPKHFVILSGDVHYSFAYDVSLRRRNSDNHIWQITASGFKNTFPNKLLAVLDRANQLLFASSSPLNWLTQRRRMKVRSRSVEGKGSRKLLNGSGVGYVSLNAKGQPVSIEIWGADNTTHRFTRR